MNAKDSRISALEILESFMFAMSDSAQKEERVSDFMRSVTSNLFLVCKKTKDRNHPTMVYTCPFFGRVIVIFFL